MAEWLGKIHKAQSDILDESYHVAEIPKALSRVGLGVLGNELFEIANTLRKAEKLIGEGVGQTLTEQINAGHKIMGEVVLAVMEEVTKQD